MEHRTAPLLRQRVGGGGGMEPGAPAAAAPAVAVAGRDTSCAAGSGSGGVEIRPLQASDVEIVVPLWAAGFAEMGPLLYDSMRRSPVVALVALAAITSALVARAWVVAGVLAAVVVVVYVRPLGGALLQRLLRAGIDSQRRRDMTPATIFKVWQRPAESEFFVALAAGRVVGCVAVALHHTLHKERASGVPLQAGEASVWRLSVDPAARRLHIGRALMEAAEGWALAQGAGAVSLITGNDDSKRFYRRIGYGVETLPRAQAVLFGPGRAAAGCGRSRLAACRLGRRVHATSGTVFVKHLPALR